jgi:tRNA/tmRNA/rRNA uracil-C5-methylase (TrmA/RlmC/RlmD family)
MTGICAYIPGAGIILSATAPVLVGLATVGTLFRVHNIISKHLTNQGFAQPVKFPFLDESLQDLEAKVNVVSKAVTEAMAQAKIMAQKYRQEKLNVEKWHQQALIYLSQGDEFQARLALTHKHTSEKLVAEFQQNCDSLTQEINKLKENYSFLERTISEVFHQQTVLDTLNTFETIYHKALWHINDLQAKLKYFDYQLFQYESSLVILEK